jgi:ribosomal protein S18 acetylase RimI-like enzyme
MRLDTLDRLGEAVSLYRALGFRTIDPYYDNPCRAPFSGNWSSELKILEPERAPFACVSMRQ